MFRRERMAAMIQQDLASIGVKLNIVTLDFGFPYRTADQDHRVRSLSAGHRERGSGPESANERLDEFRSNHQWNPNQKSPATALGSGD